MTEDFVRSKLVPMIDEIRRRGLSAGEKANPG